MINNKYVIFQNDYEFQANQLCPKEHSITQNNVEILWKEAKIGETVTAKECCNNLTRTCLEDPQGFAYWSEELIDYNWQVGLFNKTCLKCRPTTGQTYMTTEYQGVNFKFPLICVNDQYKCVFLFQVFQGSQLTLFI